MIVVADLLRFIEGDCSPEEAAAIQAWLSADPTRGELLDELQAVWRVTGGTTRRWDVAEARERLLRLRGRSAARPSLKLVRSTRPWTATTWPTRIAVAAVALIAGGVLWYPRAAAAPFREYATAPGQRSELSFRDGSRVLLSADTRLRVPRDYGVRERAVELEGEAYFVVRHDAGRPFLVRTRHGTTQDLGTEFDVRAYPEERNLQVVVAAGQVAVRGAHRADSVVLTLHPRDRAVIDARGDATISTNVRLDRHLAWTRGALWFDDAPLSDVIAQLERWYDLDIETIDASLDDERVTISFTTESADEALKALANVLNVQFTRADGLVRLAPVHPLQ